MAKVVAIPISTEKSPEIFTYILIEGGHEAQALKTLREAIRTPGWKKGVYGIYEAGDKLVKELESEGLRATHVVDIAIGTVTIPGDVR